MSDQTQPAPLNSQQIDMIQKRLIAEFKKAVDDVEMRKQAVEAVVKIVTALGDAGRGINVTLLAKEIYAFMAEPGAEIVVKVS